MIRYVGMSREGERMRKIEERKMERNAGEVEDKGD
jgi:hypothetical protein